MKLTFLSLLIFSQLVLNAQITFTKQFYSPKNSYVSTVLQTYDHGYIIMSPVGFGSNMYMTNLIKTNETGDTLWSKMYAYGKCGYTKVGLVQCPDSGFAVIGQKNGVYLLRLSKDGDSLWGKEIGSGSPYAIAITHQNDFIITGLDSTVLFIRVSYNGDLVTHKNINIIPPGHSASQFGYSIKPTNDNGSIIGGTVDWISGSYPFLVKIDYYGNLQWQKGFAFLVMSKCYSHDLTRDSGFVLAGTSYYDALLIKTDSLGDTLWVNNYKPFERVPRYLSVVTSTEGDYVACGYIGDSLYWLNHVLLTKTDENGSLIWSRQLCSAVYIAGVSVKQTYDGGFIILGYIQENDTVSRDLLLIKTNSFGEVSWIKPVSIVSSFSVYPNPANEYITLEIPVQSINFTIEIFDLSGKCLIQTKPVPGKKVTTIYIGSLESGAYLVKVSDGNNMYSAKKIIRM